MMHLVSCIQNISLAGRTLKRLGVLMLLPGCLMVEGSVFDASNTVPAVDSPVFVAFRAAMPEPDDFIEKLAAEGGRVAEIGALAVLEVDSGSTRFDTADPVFAYLAIGMLGERPISCMPAADAAWTMATRLGVSVRTRSGPADFATEDLSDMVFSGPDEIRRRFVFELFRDGELDCSVAPRVAP